MGATPVSYRSRTEAVGTKPITDGLADRDDVVQGDVIASPVGLEDDADAIVAHRVEVAKQRLTLVREPDHGGGRFHGIDPPRADSVIAPSYYSW